MRTLLSKISGLLIIGFMLISGCGVMVHHTGEQGAENPAAWQEEGFTAETAAAWQQAGVSPYVAATWQQAGFTPGSAQAMCPGGIASMADLMHMHPYDTKDKCFYLVATIMQFSGSTKGLVTLGNSVFYIDAGQGSIPANAFQFHGFVKGIGTYQYKSIIGLTKVVPYLHMISHL